MSPDMSLYSHMEAGYVCMLILEAGRLRSTSLKKPISMLSVEDHLQCFVTGNGSRVLVRLPVDKS